MSLLHSRKVTEPSISESEMPSLEGTAKVPRHQRHDSRRMRASIAAAGINGSKEISPSPVISRRTILIAGAAVVATSVGIAAGVELTRPKAASGETDGDPTSKAPVTDLDPYKDTDRINPITLEGLTESQLREQFSIPIASVTTAEEFAQAFALRLDGLENAGSTDAEWTPVKNDPDAVNKFERVVGERYQVPAQQAFFGSNVNIGTGAWVPGLAAHQADTAGKWAISEMAGGTRYNIETKFLELVSGPEELDTSGEFFDIVFTATRKDNLDETKIREVLTGSSQDIEQINKVAAFTLNGISVVGDNFVIRGGLSYDETNQ